jgi:hypothetical protein
VGALGNVGSRCGRTRLDAGGVPGVRGTCRQRPHPDRGLSPRRLPAPSKLEAAQEDHPRGGSKSESRAWRLRGSPPHGWGCGPMMPWMPRWRRCLPCGPPRTPRLRLAVAMTTRPSGSRGPVDTPHGSWRDVDLAQRPTGHSMQRPDRSAPMWRRPVGAPAPEDGEQVRGSL